MAGLMTFIGLDSFDIAMLQSALIPLAYTLAATTTKTKMGAKSPLANQQTHASSTPPPPTKANK